MAYRHVIDKRHWAIATHVFSKIYSFAILVNITFRFTFSFAIFNQIDISFAVKVTKEDFCIFDHGHIVKILVIPFWSFGYYLFHFGASTLSNSTTHTQGFDANGYPLFKLMLSHNPAKAHLLISTPRRLNCS